MADAIENLAAPDKIQTPQPQTPAITPTSPTVTAPTVPQQTTTPSAPAAQPAITQNDNDNVSIAHKKVINPISNPGPAAPDLNELLAKEGIGSLDDDDAMPTAQPSSTTSPVNPLPTLNEEADTGRPHPPGHVISPSTGTQGVDPNSIAL